MRRRILFFLLAAATIPATAAKRETVAQLEQTLTAAYASHKQDAEIARQISGMELSERLTRDTLRRFSSPMAPNSQAVLALEVLADQSEFLDPPSDELPPVAAPDASAQQRMLESAQRYGAQVLPGLPNFLATRTINRYDDSPQELKKGSWPVRAGLHRVDTSSGEISVRDERENQPPTQGSAVWQQQIGLISGGEFGTTLGMILADTARGQISWSHWERTAAGLVAVFQYSVPKSASHFEIISSLQRQAAIEGIATSTGGSRGISGIGARPNNNPSRTSMTTSRPGYHGSLWLDPVTGAVLRISMESRFERHLPVPSRRHSCRVWPGSNWRQPVYLPVAQPRAFRCSDRRVGCHERRANRWLNVTLFTGYHRFASTTRIVSGTSEAQSGEPEGASEVSRITPPESNQTASATAKPLAQAGVSSAISTAASTPAPVDSTPPVSTATESNSTPPAQPISSPNASTAEGSTRAETIAPVPVANHTDEPQTDAQTIQVNVNRVLVPVVVRDKSGRTVGGLRKEDFKLFDNDKARSIIGSP